jgi:hypothetical protein
LSVACHFFLLLQQDKSRTSKLGDGSAKNNNQIYTKATASSTVPLYHHLTKKRERIVLMASSTSKPSYIYFVTFVTFPFASQQRLLKEKQARMGAGEKRGPQNLALH